MKTKKQKLDSPLALFSPQALGYVQETLLLTHRAGAGEVEESRREPAGSLLCIPYSVDLKFNTAEMRIKKKKKKEEIMKKKRKPCKQLIFSLTAQHQSQGGDWGCN